MKRYASLLLPLLIVGCTHPVANNTAPHSNITVAVVSTGDAVPDNNNMPTTEIHVPLGQLTVFNVVRKAPFTRRVEIRNGQKTGEIKDSLKYGTSLAVTITPKNAQQREMMIDFRHSCPPTTTTYAPDTDFSVDLPSQREDSLRQRIVINKGDWVYISGSIAGVNCTLSPIAIHPVE
ncbi:hypothetical protein ABRP72_19880 [Pectobacterium carotovorum]|uniref:hypothetical protein n=1 Tax=Pectobacterium carotovorum TaxID=554 RepID=UPI0019374DEA|nr:hypothetical protein HG702_22625 [Pectobacterium versatile]